MGCCMSCSLVCFFFQADDGIRDHCVPGVQTCALPISKAKARGGATFSPPEVSLASVKISSFPCSDKKGKLLVTSARIDRKSVVYGKSVDLGGRRIIKKKKKKRENERSSCNYIK